ncbi:phage portal protein [Nocardia sp. NPDC059239]|uniref:phage portal protein n=1 Tax=unclassified Nocardia TaxID=2637762 RepID=UPI00367C26F9
MNETIRLRDLDNDENAILATLLDRLDQKKRRNLLRACYYDGKHAIRQVGTVIPPQYYKLALVLGWSAKAVDILARRCNLDGFVWPDGDLDSLGLPDVIEQNAFRSAANSAIVSSLIHSVAFLINTEGDTGEPKSLIHVKDALNATGEWNPRTRRLDNLLSITGRGERGGDRTAVTSFALYLDGLTITADWDSSGWTVDRSSHPWGVPAEAVAYKPRDGRPFGSSRISRTVMSLHDMALRTVIRMEGHADVYSYPEMWMLGADESIFKNADGSQRATWQVMLGRIKGIPDDDEAGSDVLARADVKQFPAQSPQPHLDMLKQQAQLFSGETSIPLDSLGVSDMTNPTSAESYIASREDLIAEAEGATDDWSTPFRRSMTRALAIANGERGIPAAWSSIEAKWRPPVYTSRSSQADAGMKQVTAVPWLAETSVGLELLGLTEQQIRQALAERRSASAALALTQRLAARTEAVGTPSTAPTQQPIAQP